MKTNRIEEGNKLIAEFMGFELKPHAIKSYAKEGLKQWRTKDVNSPLWRLLEGNQHEQIHFHSDWNWLMHVVEKIESMRYDVILQGVWLSVGGGKGHSLRHVCAVSEITGTQISNADSGVKIDAVYNAIVQFILWYNQKK